MAALTADVNISTVGKTTEIPLSANAADTYYQGALVFTDAAGGAQVTYAAGDRFAGVSTTRQTPTAAGDLVSVMADGFVWLPLGTNIAAADEGELLLLDADGTVSDNPGDTVSSGDITEVAGDLVIGRIKRVTSDQMLIHIGVQSGGLLNALGAV